MGIAHKSMSKSKCFMINFILNPWIISRNKEYLLYRTFLIDYYLNLERKIIYDDGFYYCSLLQLSIH